MRPLQGCGRAKPGNKQHCWNNQPDESGVRKTKLYGTAVSAKWNVQQAED